MLERDKRKIHMSKLNWGILGTGAIAKTFANGLKQSRTGQLVAAGSRSKATAGEFAEAHGIGVAHASYEALLADRNVQAVYISTPHPLHAEWAIKACEAGKHVLCEKPLALNLWQGQAIIEAARKNGVFLAEAFMYRCHPQTARLVELLREEVIGEIRLIRASLGFGGGDTVNSESRLFKNALGGGGILDVGCYPVSMARLVAGMAIGQPFANPKKVAAAGHVGRTEVDEWAAAVLQFDSGITAQVATAIRASLDNVLEIHGSKGRITVPNPWTADRENPVTGKIIVVREGQSEVMEIPADSTSFALEADKVARAVASGQQELASPGMSWEDSLGNLAVLDAWREQVGVVYEDEKPGKHQTDVVGRPVAPLTGKGSHNMRYGSIPGLDKPVSKFIFGALTAHGSFAKAQILFDHWLEVGGNAFDTAWLYGPCDKILGQWLASRGIRDDLVLTTKGAHSPFCDPESMTRQLHESLDRLQTDYTDIHILHRDNEQVPVGEFIEALNEQVEAGRIRVFGGSNWSMERFSEANAYAKANGKQGMAVLNNNLSLARMVDPVWPGCLHVSDSRSRERLAENRIVHLSWSSQARGFFTERTDKELTHPGFDKELRRCWISEDNLERRERAMQLAREKGVLPINIAAAFVLQQPFESYALIGPESIHEIETSLPGLEVTLSQEELDYLWGPS